MFIGFQAYVIGQKRWGDTAHGKALLTAKGERLPRFVWPNRLLLLIEPVKAIKENLALLSSIRDRSAGNQSTICSSHDHLADGDVIQFSYYDDARG
ncbi:hypothetical protein D3C81_1631520 [compost metagenome]